MIIDYSTKTINKTKIKKSIDEYMIEHNGEKPHYIVMSNETLKLLKKDCIYLESTYEAMQSYYTIFGVDIAICDRILLGCGDII